MMVWFTMLAILGLAHLSDDFSVLRAISPNYAISFLKHNPHALWILGAVFLCTTGAEALYSDLGHCGRSNIRISWVFVKTCLVLNYLGQGAYLLSHHNGVTVTAGSNINTFYDLMPHWFIIFGVVIATSAAIIASQAMVSGSFTLISEAMRLNLWPKLKNTISFRRKRTVIYPGHQFFDVCWVYGSCIILQESSRMEAAYGLAIIVTMLMTTIFLPIFYVEDKPRNNIVISYWLSDH